MRCHVARAGQGPDVLLVHGWGLHGGIWGAFATSLQQTARVTRVDLPGHGRSDAAVYTLDALADTLADLCSTPMTAIGWSLGALAVLTLAQRHPARVRAMVLFGATPRFVSAPDWPCAVDAALLRQFAADLTRDYRGTLSRFLTLQLGSAATERGLLKELRASVLGQAAPSPQGLRAGLAILEQTDLRPILPIIDTPALIIHGGRDRLVPPAAGAYLAAALPRARLHELPHAGHAPFLSDTAECVRQARTMIDG